MPSKRDVLEALSRQNLELAEIADIGGITGRKQADIVEALAQSRSFRLDEVLASLSRDQLKSTCRALGLDDGGREKQVLIDRLLGRKGNRASNMANGSQAERGRRSGRGNGNAPGLPVEDYRHESQRRKNIPLAKIAAEGSVPKVPRVEYAYSPRRPPVLRWDESGRADRYPELISIARERALTDEEARTLAEALRVHEPWLEWAAKREEHQRGGFKVDPVALHIHERVSAQAVLRVAARQDVERTLFGDPEQAYHEAVQFYRHDVNWTNRLILGDSLQVMASLARREDLAGKVQMIYIDPPYGIRFASNFQSEVGRRDVKDREQHLTREAEMVKAYRDTWHLGVHSYLSYLRDRLACAQSLLTDGGSIFVQISDENLHRTRALLDEVFGAQNFCALIAFSKTTSSSSLTLPIVSDYLLWYCKDRKHLKYRTIYRTFPFAPEDPGEFKFVERADGRVDSVGPGRDLSDGRVFRTNTAVSPEHSDTLTVSVDFGHRITKHPGEGRHWKTSIAGLMRLRDANRLILANSETRMYKRYFDDFAVIEFNNTWSDTRSEQHQSYVVQTATKVVERCLLMTTDPGDLVLDPTCGSGTTAYIAEQWGRRWITVDTSRVALAIARQRLLTAEYDYYRLREVTVQDRARNSQGAWLTDPERNIGGPCTLKCRTVPHITLKSIAQNTNLDPIFAKHYPVLNERLCVANAALAKVTEDIRRKLATKLLEKQREKGKRAISDADKRRWELPKKGQRWEQWQVPFDTDKDWPKDLQDAVTAYRVTWRAKMDEVNACIAANAEQEELVDQPEIVRGILRVSGPFTVEGVQPPEESLGHIEPRADGGFSGAPDELPDRFSLQQVDTEVQNVQAYLDQMLRLMRTDGVLFPDKRQMCFSRLEPIANAPGLHAEGRWSLQGETDEDREGRADVAVAFGPQYGPITAKQVEELIRTASRRGYDHLVVAGFSYDGAAQEIIENASHPKLRIHMAHIRPDVNPGMTGLLKEQPNSQLFTVFGRPRTKLRKQKDGSWIVELEGVDIYDPVNNTVLGSGASKVAAWFLDGDYDGRTFCITQAFFPNRDAWDKLARALSSSDVIDPTVFEQLAGTVSLPFPAGKHRCVAIKVIDPRGNEVMQAHRLE